jgi:soluble lytic murein transglycosylase
MRWLVGTVSLGLVLLPVPARASSGKGPDHGAERGALGGTDQAKRGADRGGERGEREAPTLEPFFASGPASKAAAHFRAGDFLAASQEAGRILAHLPRHAPGRSQLQFLRGLALMSLSSWPEAQGIFEELWSSYPLLAPYHAYHAARCHFQGGDVEGALAWLERVPEGSVPEAEATMLKVDALIKTRRWAEVDTVVQGYLARFPKGPRRTEALFDQAEALQALGRPIAEIAAAYRRVWAEATAESWATRASDRLAELAKTAPPSAAPGLSGHTTDELVVRGMLLFDANQNTEAEAIFTSALARPDLNAATRCKIRFHLAQTVWKQRQRARAAPLFDSAIADCRAAGEDDLLVRSLYQGARSYAAAGNRDKAVALYAEIEREHPDHHLTDDARLRAAEVLADAGQKTKAEQLLVDLADLYPKGDMAPEALWRLALSKWQAQSYDQALYWLDQILRRYPREDIWYADGRALYWRARVLEKQGEAKRALASYLRAVHEYPLSAYTLFSFQRLQRYPRERSALMRELRAHMRGKAESTAWSFGRQAIFAQPGFRRAVELARLGLGNETRRELAHLGLDLGNKNPSEASAGHESGAGGGSAGSGGSGGSANDDVYWIAAVLLDKSGQWSIAHTIPRTKLAAFRHVYPDGGRAEAEWRIGYPKAFPDVVARHCRESHVPEALAWAIMREESSFAPRAESFANALGLTQLMPRTAQRFAKGKITRETLFDPDKNVEIGTRFLAFLLDHYDGAVPLAISGYNAGEAGVDRWLKERGDVELDEFIETIPFDETRGYTKRVLSSYLTYAWLYDARHPVPAVAFSLRERALAKAGKPSDKRVAAKVARPNPRTTE